MSIKVVYHVTPGFNHAGIISVGVDPDRSRGKRLLSWWVSRDRLEWALAHVSAKYAVSVGALWVAEGRIPGYMLRRTRLNFVFCVGVVVRPSAFYNASHYLTDPG